MDPILEKWLELHKRYLYTELPGLDYTVRSLAKHLGVSKMTIHRWIRGQGGPKPDKVALIKKLYNL
jgi:transcriptional regulator with XRE-family HTH domain